MINFDLEKMLFTIPAEEHGIEEVAKVLRAHPEVKFVSFAGVDLGGHFTDEKIPIKTFIDDMEKLLENGVQTDGSSVGGKNSQYHVPPSKTASTGSRSRKDTRTTPTRA